MSSTKQKIIIVGGTGFVGQGIISELNSELFDIHSFSRHGATETSNRKATYHSVNLSKLDEWESFIHDADWIIDAVGILLPNPLKNQTYENSSLKPAQQIIDVLVKETRPKFLFISANAGPFFMKPYLKAKRSVEDYMQENISGRSFVVYPGIIYDKARKSSYYPAIALTYLSSISYFKKFRPIKRSDFSKNIQKILNGKPSSLQQKI